MPPAPTTLEMFRKELDDQIKNGQTHFEEQICRVQKALFQFCSLIYDRIKETKFYENDQSHIRSSEEIEYMSHLAVYYNVQNFQKIIRLSDYFYCGRILDLVVDTIANLNEYLFGTSCVEPATVLVKMPAATGEKGASKMVDGPNFLT